VSYQGQGDNNTLTYFEINQPGPGDVVPPPPSREALQNIRLFLQLSNHTHGSFK